MDEPVADWRGRITRAEHRIRRKELVSRAEAPILGGRSMRLVIIESPYAGDVEANIRYARACVLDCLRRGEAPFASHLLYTQPGILRDEVPAERESGIAAAVAWCRAADATVVYTDRGISRGMEFGIAAARQAGKPVEFRSLGAAGATTYRTQADASPGGG
jgi:hypothetical protein